jgi:hypothetical protein
MEYYFNSHFHPIEVMLTPESSRLGEEDDGWADHLSSLEDFPYKKYGMIVQA